MTDPARALLEAELTSDEIERIVIFSKYQLVLKSPGMSSEPARAVSLNSTVRGNGVKPGDAH